MGNVYARNPSTGYFGPVCDDGWNVFNVSIYRLFFIYKIYHSKCTNLDSIQRFKPQSQLKLKDIIFDL